MRPIRGRRNARGKRRPAHQVIDKDPVESVGVEGFPARGEIHGNERLLLTQDVPASPYVNSFSVTPLLDFFLLMNCKNMHRAKNNQGGAIGVFPQNLRFS